MNWRKINLNIFLQSYLANCHVAITGVIWPELQASGGKDILQKCIANIA